MDALEAVGDPELRSALRFVRSRRSPVSADELAAAESVHRNVARSRLERLEGAGLLVTSFERRSGRTGPGAGRPAKVYSPAPEITQIEFPERNYEQLVGLLVDALPARGRKRRLRESTSHRWSEMRAFMPTSTFSIAVMLAKSRMFWNVRQIPSAVI